MEKVNIWKSANVAPTTRDLWYNQGQLKHYTGGSWKEVNKNNLPIATAEKEGVVKQLTAETLLEEKATLPEVIEKVNSLIVKMQAAGIMQ